MKTGLMVIGLAVCLILAATSCNQRTDTYFVDSSSALGGNGSSWLQAFNNLDSALSAASLNKEPTQIWIAAGTYKPTIKYGGGYTGSEPNLATFNLPNNVALYGCFEGDETLLSQRNCNANPTILSGDLAGNDVNTPDNTLNFKADNAWHVLTTDGTTGVTLDGLIVTGGYAAGPDLGTVSTDGQFTIATLNYTHATGGGLLARNGALVTLRNMRFDYNSTDSLHVAVRGPSQIGGPALASGGGAVAAIDDGTLVTIQSSTFNYNTAYNLGSNGGALNAISGGSYSISNSSFSNNVGNRDGGAIHAKDANFVTILSSTFSNNKIVTLDSPRNIGDESGGAIGVIDTDLSVSHSTFSNNIAAPAGGGAIFFQAPFDDGTPYALDVNNSTFVNNRSGSIGGGAINAFGVTPHAGTKASISNCMFVNNIAGTGGAVYVDSIPTMLTGSTFIGNQAWVNGGAVFGSSFGDSVFGLLALADHAILDISSSTFTGNSIVGIPQGASTPVFAFNLVANFQGATHGLQPNAVTALQPGGGAIASELGGNIAISDCIFQSNSAPNAHGGAVLVGGSVGCGDGSCAPGMPQLEMDQAYVTLATSLCFGNTDVTGNNNTSVLDPGGLGSIPNGVLLVSDGSCP